MPNKIKFVSWINNPHTNEARASHSRSRQKSGRGNHRRKRFYDCEQPNLQPATKLRLLNQIRLIERHLQKHPTHLL